MEPNDDLINKDKSLDKEYHDILKKFESKQISEIDYIKKFQDLHVRLLIHLEDTKNYNSTALTSREELAKRIDFTKNEVKKHSDLLIPKSEEQKKIEEQIRKMADMHQNERVTDVFISENDGRRFGLHLTSGDSEFVDFDNQRIPLDFPNSAFEILNELVLNKKDILKKWANDYKDNCRDFYFFLYDLPTLAKFLDQLPSEFDKLKKLEGNYDELLHNRMIAQLAVQYQDLGFKVDTEIENKKGKFPDLHVNDDDMEVKTIVSEAINHPDHFVRFSKSLRNRFGEAVEQIFQEKDMVAIVPWSQIMNNTLKTYYDGLLVTKISSFEKGHTVLVLEGETAFEDYYYIVPSSQIVDDIRKFCESGYRRIGEYAYFGYFRRSGYAITRSGPARQGFGMTFAIR